MKKNINKELFWLGFVLSIIFLLLANIFSWIKDKDYEYLLTIIGYKWQVTFFLLIIFVLVFMIIYQKVFKDREIVGHNNPSDDKLKETLLKNVTNNEESMDNLSSEEKDIISKYLQNNTKTLEFYDSAVLRTLVKNHILFNPYSGYILGNKRDFTLEEWAWKYINNNKNKFN
jgi:hypothetical protein